MKQFLIFGFLILLCSCSPPGDYYKLDDQYLARRQIETKRFEAIDEGSIINASTQVLQDLGFNLEESEIRLGLITASKDREAGTTGGKAAIIFLAAMGDTQAVYDVNQKIYATIVSTKSKDKGFNVRVQFARVIWNNLNQMRMEKIQEPLIYQDFFDRLSQSIFLTANNI